MDELKRQYLEAMGIRAWFSRDVIAAQPEEVNATTPVAPPEITPVPVESDPGGAAELGPGASGAIADLDWEALQERVAACSACSELVANRTQTVFGVGNRNADWLVIGEAPGADEDRQGEPFVGKAGQLLNNMLRAIGLKREQVYIANILKCRPPRNRDPAPEEVAACAPFLKRQIALVQPRIILVVGRVAAQSLLGTSQPIGKLRGRRHQYGDSGIPVVVTYHPAYLLRSPGEKRKAWGDLKMAVSVFRETA